jgi:hypothetical protein
MFRVMIFLSALGSLGACGVSGHIEPIPKDKAYEAFQDVKNQLVDWQGHMAYLAIHPEDDLALKLQDGGRTRVCGTEGGIRLDITSATVSLVLATGGGSGAAAGITGMGGLVSNVSGALGTGRKSSIGYTYAVELDSVPRPKKSADLPLSQALGTLRESIILSQFDTNGAEGCLRIINDPEESFAVIELVKSKNNRGDFQFAIGPMVINPTVGNEWGLANKMIVRFEVSVEDTATTLTSSKRSSNRANEKIAASTDSRTVQTVTDTPPPGPVVFSTPFPIFLDKPLIPITE